MRIRPSPQPRSYMKSPFLTSASSSIRSTTGIVVGTNGIGSCDHAVELLKTNSKAVNDAICLSFKWPPPSRKIWLSSVQDRMKCQLRKEPFSILPSYGLSRQGCKLDSSRLVSCLRSSLHNLIVIPGKLAIASATRNPGKSKASGFPKFSGNDGLGLLTL